MPQNCIRRWPIFGAPLENIKIDDFSVPGTVFQVGVIPRRIDIITKISGLNYAEASAGKEIVKIDDLSIPIISKQNLIINKLATGREKDRLDAETLKKIR